MVSLVPLAYPYSCGEAETKTEYTRLTFARHKWFDLRKVLNGYEVSPMTLSLRIAAAQFPVSGDIARNMRYIRKHMRTAAREGVHAVHFPETALPGYAPKHLGPLDNYAWCRLDRYMLSLRELAASLDLWVVLGSMRRIDGGLPRNCIYVISRTGEIEAVYGKRRLYGVEASLYSAGHTPCVVDINGFKCGFLICYDNCFPELYSEYRDMGVGLVFHSFCNAGNSRVTSIKELMSANLIVRAADHQLWICATNSSERYSPLSARIVRPDGSMIRSKRHVSGLAIDNYPEDELGWTYDNRRAYAASNDHGLDS